MRVLVLGSLLEELIYDARAERMLHRGLSHEGDVVAPGEAVEDLGGDHGAGLLGKWLTPSEGSNFSNSIQPMFRGLPPRPYPQTT